MQTGSHVDSNAAISPWKSLSTAGIKPSERREFWQSNVGPLCGGFHLEPQSDEPFNANLNYTNVADLVFCRLFTSVRHRIVHTAGLVNRVDRALVKVVFQTEGNSLLEQDGQTAVLQPGDWTIYNPRKPSSAVIPGRAGIFFLTIPSERILTPNFDLGSFAAHRFSGSRGLGKLIWSLLSATFDQIPEIGNRAGQKVADITIQLIRLAVLEFIDEHVPVDSKEAIRERVKRYISSHLRDPDLSITNLAGTAGCTKRYLHMVFHSENVSISDYILKLRLQRCREDLLNPEFVHRSITDIAYSWGFNSSNHFSRCFKQEFGVSPRSLRTEFAQWPSGSAEKPVKVS
ncbi:MAG TPA: helix-turn-helix domain-containing protein [Candidatus Acidoferrales bacterium]|nr:helix-turn-helix domain-containing protein [Candidatus Acidoferrales bacterium]